MPSRIVRSGLGLGFAVSESDGSEIKTGTSASSGNDWSGERRRSSRMRYERLTDIVRLATHLQGTRGGLTMDDIVAEFRVSRRTAERMRDAVEAAFGPLQPVDTGDNRIHWRLQSTSLRGLVRITPEELAELESAASRLDQAGLAERAGILRELVAKLLALRRSFNEDIFGDDLEVLMRAEKLAMRPGPAPSHRTRIAAVAPRCDQGHPQGEIRIRCEVFRAAEPATRRTLRSALRQPRLPGRERGLGRTTAALESGEREQGPYYRPDV